MSHHADSGLAVLYPQLDICDLFIFPGKVGTVFIMTVNPMSGPGGFYAGGQYAFHIDRTGDGRPDITYRASFGDEFHGAQLVELRQLEGHQASDRDAAGTMVASGVTGTLNRTPAGVRLWAGQAADPGWMHEGVLSAAQRCITKGEPFDTNMGQSWAMNILAYSNVHAVVLELPLAMLGTARIGVWATTAMPAGARPGWTQVNRCAIPLLNLLFDIDNEATGLHHNATGPAEDRELYGHVVRAGAAVAARALGSAADPVAHGDRVAATLLPDMLSYQPGTRAYFGPGSRNGRGLRDPAPEAVLSLALGTDVPLGLDASSATGYLRAVFPYLAAPVDTAEPPDPFQ